MSRLGVETRVVESRRRSREPHRRNRGWLVDVRDCPPDALGFDFDGATFTLVGNAVTFEVLMQSFGLGDDRGLALLGEMVRSLDITGAPRALKPLASRRSSRALASAALPTTSCSMRSRVPLRFCAPHLRVE